MAAPPAPGDAVPMAMGAHSFRFEHPPSEAVLRERLRAEVGRRRAGERCVELDWHAGGGLMVLSMDGIALLYAAKVCVALGGVRLRLGTADEQPLVLPGWAHQPWVSLPWWTRFRLWLGPTKL
jgi:hypothetical protein